MSKNSLAPINDVNLKIFDEICEERFAKLDLDAVLISIIDNVPADALPHLAEQYHITGNEGWLQALSDTEKRNLIKSSIKMHRYKGTKYALEEIFKTLNIVGNIEEWFNYGACSPVPTARVWPFFTITTPLDRTLMLIYQASSRSSICSGVGSTEET